MTPTIPRHIRRLRLERAAYAMACAVGGSALVMLFVLLALSGVRALSGYGLH